MASPDIQKPARRRARRRCAVVRDGAASGPKPRARRALTAVLALLGVLAVPSVAAAQDTTFYLDRLRIGGAHRQHLGIA